MVASKNMIIKKISSNWSGRVDGGRIRPPTSNAYEDWTTDQLKRECTNRKMNVPKNTNKSGRTMLLKKYDEMKEKIGKQDEFHFESKNFLTELPSTLPKLTSPSGPTAKRQKPDSIDNVAKSLGMVLDSVHGNQNKAKSYDEMEMLNLLLQINKHNQGLYEEKKSCNDPNRRKKLQDDIIYFESKEQKLREKLETL